jgi:hypothetical protein
LLLTLIYAPFDGQLVVDVHTRVIVYIEIVSVVFSCIYECVAYRLIRQENSCEAMLRNLLRYKGFDTDGTLFLLDIPNMKIVYVRIPHLTTREQYIYNWRENRLAAVPTHEVPDLVEQYSFHHINEYNWGDNNQFRAAVEAAHDARHVRHRHQHHNS